MALRKLSPEEVAKLGLDAPAPGRRLAPDEAAKLGLDAPAPAGDDSAFGGYSMGSVAGADDGPGVFDSALSGAEQGLTLGHADEIAGAARSLFNGTKYTDERDKSRAAFKRDQEANPLAFGAGNVVGGIGAQAALAAATGGTSLGAQAALAAGMSAVNAEGESNADNVGDLAKDTALGGAEGLAALGAGHLVGKYGAKAVNAAVKKVAPELAERLDKLAVEQGRRVLTNGADSLSTRKELSEDAVRAALDRGAIKAGGTTQGAYDRLQDLAETEGAKYGEIVKGLEGAGVEGPRVDDIAKTLSAKAQAAGASTLDSQVPGLYERNAEGILTKAGEDGRIPVGRAEDIKRDLQGRARYDRTASSDVNEARKDVASLMRQSVEDQIEGQSTEAGTRLQALRDIDAATLSPEAAAHHVEELERLGAIDEFGKQFVPQKKIVGDLISARDAAERGTARGAQRNKFGLTDRMAVVAGLAQGNVAGVAKGVIGGAVSNLINGHGASTVASIANTLSKKLGKVGAYAALNPSALGKWGGVLAGALQRGGASELNSKAWVLNQTDPDFAKHVESLPDHEDPNAVR